MTYERPSEKRVEARYMREALGILALSEGDSSPNVKAESPEQVAVLPEISEHARDQLLYNLNLTPSDREIIHQEAFSSSRYKALQRRLKILTEGTFSDIYQASPAVHTRINEVLKSKATALTTLDDLATGTALALEAYQIYTGSNLLRGFANIDEIGIVNVEVAFNTILPANKLFIPIIDQAATLPVPKAPYAALAQDIRLIGDLTVERNPIVIQAGALGALQALQLQWPAIYSPELPPHRPSNYKADSILG